MSIEPSFRLTRQSCDKLCHGAVTTPGRLPVTRRDRVLSVTTPRQSPC